MSMAERLAFVLSLDADGAIRGFKRVGDTAERELGRTESRLDRMGGRMQVMGAGAMAFAGVAGAALVSLVGDAAELEQAIGGTEAVFGDAAGTIEEFASRSATSMGLSESAFRQATTSIGGNLQRMGVDLDTAAQLSIDLTQVGADLAATYGGTTAEAVNALGAAFRGEADPAERFNLNLKAGEVAAKAVEMGLASSASQVSEYARAQATVALIMEQSTAAQGQFARESDTTAGRIAIASAQIEDFKAAMGGAVAQIVGPGAAALGSLAQKFNDLPPSTQDAISKVAVFGTAAIGMAGATSYAVGTIIKFRDNMRTAVDALRRMRDNAGGTGAAMTKLGVIVAAAALPLMEYNQLQAERAAYEAEAASAATAIAAGIAETGDAMQATNQYLQDLIAGNQDLASVLAATGVGTYEVAQAFAEGGESADQMIARLLAGGEAAGFNGRSMIELATTLANYSGAAIDAQSHQANLNAVQGEGADTAGAAARSTEEIEAAHREAAEATRQHEQAMRGLMTAMDEAHGRTVATTDLIARWEASVDDLTGSIAENGASLDLNTEQGRTNYAAGRDVADGLIDLMKRRFEETGSLREAIEAGDGYVGNLREQLRQAGLTEDQITEYIETLGLLPSEVVTNIRANTAEAVREIQALQRELAGVTANSHTVNVHVHRSVSESNARAEGGPVSAGHTYLVGERGPEIFTPNRSGTIIPNHAVPKTSGGSALATSQGPGPVVVHVHVAGSLIAEADLITKIQRGLVEAQRRNPSLAFQ